jgi:D-arabinose 5-phosphate isomerase GutQ
MVRAQLASAIDFVIQQACPRDGSRKVASITEVQRIGGDALELSGIFTFDELGMGEDRAVGEEVVHYSPTDIVARARDVIAREVQAVKALEEQLDEGLVHVLNLLLNCKGHILVAGMGTSHAVAQRFAHLLSCCGTPALCIDAADSLHGGAGAITSHDVLFVISKGGRSAEINALVEIAHARGAKIIAQTENPEAPLGQMSDVIFTVQAVGDVDPYGFIATGSSLVNAAAGDVLCTLLLELRGYSKQEFGLTHPGGAVGRRLAEGDQ